MGNIPIVPLDRARSVHYGFSTYLVWIYFMQQKGKESRATAYILGFQYRFVRALL
jgi:hypothetical protein